MITIVTKIFVNKKTPEQIYNWLLNLDYERYIQWHPTAHKDFKRIYINKNITGSIFYFDEFIGKLRVNYKWEIIKTKQNKLIFTKAKSVFPIYLLISLDNMFGGTEVTHDLRIGFKFIGIANLVDLFANSFILTFREKQAIHQHAKEEFTNLEHWA